MGLNELFMQRAMMDRQNRINLEQDNGINIGSLLSTVVGSVLPKIMEQKEEQNRQARVKDQITNFQSMMQKMNEMPDNSDAARGVGVLDDEVSKDRKGVVGITRYVPQFEQSIDENGAINLKMGVRATTPQEQSAQYEMSQKQMAQRKAEAKAQTIDGYIRGEVQEGAILKGMGFLGITPEEFDWASQARSRFRQVAQMQANAMQQNQQQMSMAQPQSQPMPQEQPMQSDQPFMFKKKEPTGAQVIRKEKMTQDLLETVETNKVKKDQIEQARELAKEIKGGIGGAIERGWMKAMDPNNPMLGKWQVIKGVLTDAQLLNTAKTKGAISDREMALFASAAANDDIASLPRMIPVFDKLVALMDAEERAKKMSYQKNYNEDPDEFLGDRGGAQGMPQAGQGGSVPSVGGTFNGEKVISVKRIR